MYKLNLQNIIIDDENLYNYLCLNKDNYRLIGKILMYGYSAFQIEKKYNEEKKDYIKDKDEIINVLSKRINEIEDKMFKQADITNIVDLIQNLNITSENKINNILKEIYYIKEFMKNENELIQKKINIEIEKLRNIIINLYNKVEKDESNSILLSKLNHIIETVKYNGNDSKIQELKDYINNNNIINIENIINIFENLKNKIDSSQNNEINVLQNIIDNIQKINNEKILNNLQISIENIKLMLINRYTNKEIGNIGEFMIEDYIRKNISGSIINNVSKNFHQGDLLLEYKNFKIMIEIKNWKTDITKNDIIKFKQNLENNENCYDAGIIISLNTNIQNHKDMDYEVTSSGKNCSLFK